MVKCKHCKFSNFAGTNYCQNCGRFLKQKRIFPLLTGGIFASISNKGFALALLTAMAVEGQAREMQRQGKRAGHLVKAVPLKNGDWYCPDCGELNRNYSICHGCGREQ